MNSSDFIALLLAVFTTKEVIIITIVIALYINIVTYIVRYRKKPFQPKAPRVKKTAEAPAKKSKKPKKAKKGKGKGTIEDDEDDDDDDVEIDDE